MLLEPGAFHADEFSNLMQLRQVRRICEHVAALDHPATQDPAPTLKPIDKNGHASAFAA